MIKLTSIVRAVLRKAKTKIVIPGLGNISYGKFKPVPELKTTIQIGQTYVDSEILRVVPYRKLRDYDLGIYIRNIPKDKQKTKNQRTEYYIKKSFDNADIGYLPKGNVLHFCAKPKLFILTGKNILYPEPFVIGEKKKPIIYTESSSNFFNSNIHSFSKDLEQTKILKEIKEVPIMYDIDNRLICVPLDVPPVVGFFGSRGSGKTMGMHSLLDRIYHTQCSKQYGCEGDRIALFNSNLNQFNSWQLKNKIKWMNKINKLLGHIALPLPMIYLYPCMKKFKIGDSVKYLENQFPISLPFLKSLEENNYFFEGVKELQDFKGSQKYFKNIIEDFKYMKTPEEILNHIEITLGDRNETKASAYKMKEILSNLFDLQIWDFNTGTPYEWDVYVDKVLKKMLPMSACLDAGLVPCNINNHLKSSPLFAQYNRWILDDVFENQKEKKFTGDKRLWMGFDELSDYHKINNKSTVLTQSVIDIFQQGRNPNVGVVYTMQVKEDAELSITNNTTHMIVMRTNETNFPKLDREQKKELSRLKNFECYAIPQDEFIAYNIDGTRIKITEPVRGTIFFPLSEHTKPGGASI